MDTEERISIHERLTTLETKMDKVIEQTSKTNGSVASLKLWRAYLTGGLAILTAIVVPVLFMFLANYLEK